MEVVVQDPGIPDIYHLDNFNDVITSFITLFTLMMVNNWMVTVQMYVEIMGNDTNIRWYFVIFYYFSVIVGINIVVAYALDMYTAVERLDKAREEQL
jgi:two pore calcium channel protein 1